MLNKKLTSTTLLTFAMKSSWLNIPSTVGFSLRDSSVLGPLASSVLRRYLGDRLVYSEHVANDVRPGILAHSLGLVHLPCSDLSLHNLVSHKATNQERNRIFAARKFEAQCWLRWDVVRTTL